MTATNETPEMSRVLTTVDVGGRSMGSCAGAARCRESARGCFPPTSLTAGGISLHRDLPGRRRKPLAAARAGLVGEERDPVRGRRLIPDEDTGYEYAGHLCHFCFGCCRERFWRVSRP